MAKDTAKDSKKDKKKKKDTDETELVERPSKKKKPINMQAAIAT